MARLAARTAASRGWVWPMSFAVLVQLGAATTAFIAAASSAKAWALSPSTPRVAVTLLLCTAGNLLMLRLIRPMSP